MRGRRPQPCPRVWRVTFPLRSEDWLCPLLAVALEDFSNSSSVSPLASRLSSRVTVAALRVCASWRPGVSQAGQPLCAQSLLCTQQSCTLPGLQGHPRPCSLLLLSPPAQRRRCTGARSRPRQGGRGRLAAPSQAGGSGRPGTGAVVCLRRCPKMVPSHARSWEGASRMSAPSSWRPLLGKRCLGELTSRGHLSLAPCRSVPRACARGRPAPTSRAAHPSVPRSRPQDAACPPGSTGTRASPHSRPGNLPSLNVTMFSI